MDCSFHPDVEPHHRRIDPGEFDDAYVVGDVHGCPEPLDRLLETLGVTGDDFVVFVGSADWMTRNLDRRVEAVAPVFDAALQADLDAIIETMLADNRRRWLMQSDGSYVQARPKNGEPVRDTHEVLMNRACAKAPEAERVVESDPEPGREPNVDLDELYTTKIDQS